jgi:hypothetical protein
MLFGKKINKYFFYKVSIFLLLLLISTSNIYATTGVPSTISYQGHLTDSGGNPLGGAGTTYYFKFSFYDSPTVGQGTKLWPTSSPTATSLTVRQGVFSVNIGDTANGYPDTLDYDFNTNKNIYLQVEISSDNNTFETLSPRSSITSSAFSQVADRVVGTSQSSFGTTTPITNSLISAITTSINQVAMTIRGIAGQVANLFNIQDSNGNSLFTVTSAGNVGIGTTSPVAKLSVADSSTGFSDAFVLKGTATNNNGSTRFNIQNENSSLIINAYGSNASLNANLKNSIGFFADGSLTNKLIIGHTGTAAGNDIQFFTNGSYGSPQMVLTQGGNVGIGTTTPINKLSVVVPTNDGFRLYNSTNGYKFELSFPTGASGEPTISACASNMSNCRIFQRQNVTGDVFVGDIDNNGGAIRFRSAGSTNMSLTSTGNLGIGTTTPTAKLSVNANSGDTNTYIMNVSSSTASSANSLFRIRNDGRVFVGTSDVTNSISILNINGDTYTSGNMVVGGTLYMPTLAAGAGSNLRLATYNSPYVYLTRDIINSQDLKFGIGTTTPTAQLTTTGSQILSTNRKRSQSNRRRQR